MENKYKLFKNFMHNELGISKEDIHQWLKDAIKEEAKNLVEQAYGKCNIESVIKSIILDYDFFEGKTLRSSIRDRICRDLAEMIMKKVSINNDK